MSTRSPTKATPPAKFPSLSFNFTPEQMAVIYCPDDPEYVISKNRPGNSKKANRNKQEPALELTPRQQGLKRKFQIVLALIKKHHTTIDGRINMDKVIEATRDYFMETEDA